MSLFDLTGSLSWLQWQTVVDLDWCCWCTPLSSPLGLPPPRAGLALPPCPRHCATPAALGYTWAPEKVLYHAKYVFLQVLQVLRQMFGTFRKWRLVHNLSLIVAVLIVFNFNLKMMWVYLDPSSARVLTKVLTSSRAEDRRHFTDFLLTKCWRENMTLSASTSLCFHNEVSQWLTRQI